MSDLFDVSILITGASQGLGRQFARVLSAQGAAVVLAARQTGRLKSLEEEIKAKGAYFLATEMARRMIARKQEGNIVNIASVLGQSVMKFLSPYTISKAGIIQATKAMALELAGNRIRINALAPGYIDTEMNHEFWAIPAGEKLTKRIPQRRAESDLDGAITLWACGASRYMTGSVLTVDGGFLLN
jgi:NAD(P)-dependent dehydrogenase (short-subunit alcohol dehydrogenase family)